MFDFLKRKKKEPFGLDEYSVPSLSEKEGDKGFGMEAEGAGMGEGMGFAPSGGVSQGEAFSQPLTQPQQAGFGDTSPSFPGPSPMMTPQGGGFVVESGLQADFSRAKLETIEAKVTLMDARLASIEQKIEFLSQLVMNGVSDETKRKFNVEQMMKGLRK